MERNSRSFSRGVDGGCDPEFHVRLSLRPQARGFPYTRIPAEKSHISQFPSVCHARGNQKTGALGPFGPMDEPRWAVASGVAA